jgi:hypothetical protein
LKKHTPEPITLKKCWPKNRATITLFNGEKYEVDLKTSMGKGCAKPYPMGGAIFNRT